MSLIPVNESLSSEEHTQSAPCPGLCPATSALILLGIHRMAEIIALDMVAQSLLS